MAICWRIRAGKHGGIGLIFFSAAKTNRLEEIILRKETYNLKAAAKYLGKSESWLRGEIKHKRIAYVKIGIAYFFSEADLDDYLRRCRVPVREGAR